jgi:hypothetical protein
MSRRAVEYARHALKPIDWIEQVREKERKAFEEYIRDVNAKYEDKERESLLTSATELAGLRVQFLMKYNLAETSYMRALQLYRDMFYSLSYDTLGKSDAKIEECWKLLDEIKKEEEKEYEFKKYYEEDESDYDSDSDYYDDLEEKERKEDYTRKFIHTGSKLLEQLKRQVIIQSRSTDLKRSREIGYVYLEKFLHPEGSKATESDVHKALHWFNNAIKLAESEHGNIEAEMYGMKGFINDKILKIEKEAVTNYLKCYDLCKRLPYNMYTSYSWYKRYLYMFVFILYF